MTDITKRVRRIYNEEADQELDKKGYNSVLTPLSPLNLTPRERWLLNDLIDYKAERLRCAPYHIAWSTETRFEVVELDDLPQTRFLEAVVYIATYEGAH